MPCDTGSVTVYRDCEALSLAAAGLFAVQARAAAAATGRCDVLLSGGATPGRCYQLLGEEPLRGSVPWHALQLFWGDERWVPHDDPRSNYGMLRRTLLEKVPLGEDQVHPVPFAATPEAAAASYQALLLERFEAPLPRFDLALQGLGADGHTASLFPGDPALTERERLVREVYLPEEDLHRVTVTAPVINNSAVIAFLVSGKGKAAILRQVLEGECRPERCPAQLIHPTDGRLLWLVDRAAAALLSPELSPATES